MTFRQVTPKKHYSYAKRDKHNTSYNAHESQRAIRWVFVVIRLPNRLADAFVSVR